MNRMDTHPLRRSRAFLTVFLKEVRENLRDRRTLTSAFLTGPLLTPLLFVMLISFTVNRELDKAEQPLKVPVIGAQYAPNLVGRSRRSPIRKRPCAIRTPTWCCAFPPRIRRPGARASRCRSN